MKTVPPLKKGINKRYQFCGCKQIKIHVMYCNLFVCKRICTASNIVSDSKAKKGNVSPDYICMKIVWLLDLGWDMRHWTSIFYSFFICYWAF